MVEYNTIIIGSGISGMSCAIYLKRAGLSVLMIENNVPGGQLHKIDLIENYPGYVSVRGGELANSLLEQVSSYEIDFVYDEIKRIDYDNKLIFIGENSYQYKYLVFATGRRERTLGLRNEEKFIGNGISFCATCDGALYKDRDVIVVGGANSAVTEAVYLANICHKVYLIYRNERLRSEEILRKRLEDKKNVQVLYGRCVCDYLIRDGVMEGVELDNGEKILASCVFLAIGYIPNSELFDGEKDHSYIVVDSHYATSRKDVYACGDVIQKGLYQLVTASSDGAMVASSIIQSNLR